MKKIVYVVLLTLQTKRFIGGKGDFHGMGMLQKAITGEVVNNLNLFKGHDLLLVHTAYLGTLWAAVSGSS